ncbi:hypothetical protein NOR51B_1756 [Luminiphilus syltensis NOR5-1B]|uniref:Uncharacterized protein n=1 Tax=Luminiphilus syltensis NOR5-1B TaxID=565045 RepID=B8KTR3_9GAMM|nr:hypothetical protein NOR51B_1756 [Luminiphilus syltensis NOR5-1B]
MAAAAMKRRVMICPLRAPRSIGAALSGVFKAVPLMQGPY